MRYRVTFEIPASELDDFTRLGICSPPKTLEIESIKPIEEVLDDAMAIHIGLDCLCGHPAWEHMVGFPPSFYMPCNHTDCECRDLRLAILS